VIVIRTFRRRDGRASGREGHAQAPYDQVSRLSLKHKQPKK